MLSLADLEAFLNISRALEKPEADGLSDQERRLLLHIVQSAQPSAAAMFGFPVQAPVPAMAHDRARKEPMRRVAGMRG